MSSLPDTWYFCHHGISKREGDLVFSEEVVDRIRDSYREAVPKTGSGRRTLCSRRPASWSRGQQKWDRYDDINNKIVLKRQFLGPCTRLYMSHSVSLSVCLSVGRSVTQGEFTLKSDLTCVKAAAHPHANYPVVYTALFCNLLVHILPDPFRSCFFF